MKALRIHVERVVRPIRASHLRKDRMREELLEHLTQMYDEELSRSHVIATATDQAIARFGNATALRRELQDSVPRLERWGFYPFPNSGPVRRRVGESPMRFLLRMHARGLLLGIASFVVITILMTISIGQRPHRVAQVTRGELVSFMGCCILLQIVGSGVYLFVEKIRQELERCAAAPGQAERRQATGCMIAYAISGSLLLGSCVACFMLAWHKFLPVSIVTEQQFWWIVVGITAAGFPISLLMAWSWRATMRRFDLWESLDLDEASAD